MSANEVFVSLDFTEADEGWGVTKFNSVEKAVLNVADGGTVRVAAGIYDEKIAIDGSMLSADKAFSLVGEKDAAGNLLTTFTGELVLGSYHRSPVPELNLQKGIDITDIAFAPAGDTAIDLSSIYSLNISGCEFTGDATGKDQLITARSPSNVGGIAVDGCTFENGYITLNSTAARSEGGFGFKLLNSKLAEAQINAPGVQQFIMQGNEISRTVPNGVEADNIYMVRIGTGASAIEDFQISGNTFTLANPSGSVLPVDEYWAAIVLRSSQASGIILTDNVFSSDLAEFSALYTNTSGLAEVSGNTIAVAGDKAIVNTTGECLDFSNNAWTDGAGNLLTDSSAIAGGIDGTVMASCYATSGTAGNYVYGVDEFIAKNGSAVGYSTETLKVDSAWSSYSFGDAIDGETGYYYGINAFSSLNDALAQKTAGTQTITTLSAIEETSDGGYALLGNLTLGGEKITYSGASLTFLGGGVNATLTVNADMALTTNSSGLLGVSYDGRPMTVKINSDVRAYIYYAYTGSTTIVNESGKLFATGEQLLARGTGTTITYNGNAAVGAAFEERTLQGGAGFLQLRDSGNIALNNTLFEVTAGAVSVNHISGTGSRLLLNNTYINDKGHPDSRNSQFIINAGDGLVQVDNHSSLVFSGSGVGTMTVNGNGSKLEITGNSLVSGYAVTNSGTIDVTGSALSATSVTNNGSISVAGNSKLNIDSLTGNVNLVDGASLSDSVIGSGTVVTTGNITLSGNVTLGKFNAVDGEGEAGNSITIAADADVRMNGEVRIRTNDAVHIYGALTVGDAADFYKKNGSEMTIYKDGVLTLEDSSFQNNSLLTVFGEMNLNYVDGWAPKLAGNETGKYSGQLVVDGKDGKGIVNVKTPYLTFGGGLGSTWKEAADGCTVDILNNGKIVTDAKAFWNSSKNTLTLNHGSLIFDAANSAYDSAWQADSKFDNDGVMSGSNSSVIDMSGRTFTNNGSVSLADSTLTAGTLVNNNTVNVSGNSKISAAFTGELSIKDGAVLTTDGLTGTGHLVIDEGATATLSGSGFDFNGYIYGATNKYNQEGVAGFTLNIENAEDFSNSALYASNASRYNLMNSKVETTTLNVNATGKVAADKDSSVTVESAHILGALETSGELVADIFNIYAGFGADDAAGQVSLKSGSSTTVYRLLNIGTANRPDAKYNATATGDDEKIAKLDLDNATLKFVAIHGEVPHFYVGSDSSAGLLTATASSIELGENQSVDFRVGTLGTVVLSDTSFTLLRNSAFSNFGAVMTDYASTITVGGTFTNSGTITVDMTGAAANGLYKLIDNTGATAMTLADYGNVILNNAAGYTLSVIDNDLYALNADMSTIQVNAAWGGTAPGTEIVIDGKSYYYGINAFSGLNQALGEAAAGSDKIVIAAGPYDESAAQFVKGGEVVSENAVFSNVWSFGVNSDTGRDFDMETAEKFTVTGDLTVGQFYAEKNANVYVKIDGNLTTVGSFGAKLATQVDVNGTVTVTPEPSSQVMVYGTMNVTGTLDVTTGAMGAVLIVGRESYETEYGKGGVLNVSGADASVVLRNNTGSAIPVTVSALSSLTIADGATFINETGGLKNLGTVTVNNGTLTLREAFENSGTLNFSNTTTDFGTVANADGGMVNFLGGNEISGTVLGGGDVNFNGILSFEEAAEGEPSVIAQKNGAAVTLKAGKDVLTGKVAAEDVNVGGMASGMVSGVEQLVLQGGSLALEDLTIHAGSSLTMDLNSSFAFSGTVAVNQAGVVVDGTTAYVYGAGSFTVDASAFTTGSYKVIDYTGTAVQDYSFVSNLGELENKLIFNNDLYITDKNAEILYVSNSYTGDAGDVTADGNILGYNAFATAEEAFSSANSSGGATIDLQDEVYTHAAPQGTGVELTNAGTYTVINGKGVLLNYELEVNPDKADGEYLLNVEDAHLTLTKLTLRANATMTVTDSRIDYNAFEGGSAYLSVYTNSVLNVSGSTIGFDPRQSKVNDPADLPDAGTGAGAYWNWAPTWNIYGTANIEDSTLFAYVGQANQAGFDVRGNGTATITGSEVSLALLNVGTSYEENKLDPAADKSNLLATLTLDGTTVRNTQYRGDNTTQNGINVGQEDGTSAGKLVIRNGSDIDFTVLSYNDAREIGLSVRNDKSSVEISDSTFKAPSITNNGTITVSGSVLKADEVKNDGTILVSGTSVLNISALTGEIVLVDGATLTDSSVGGTVSAEGNVSVAGTTSVDRLVLKGVRGENSELSIGADAVVAVKQLEVGTGLQKPDLVPGDPAAREYFSKAQIDGALTVDRANQAGAIYIRPYAELVVTGTLNVKGEVHNRGSLVVDGGTMNISDWETPKLLGYTTGDSLTVTNQGSMILTGVSAVTFGEAHASKAEMGVEAQYADGMFATISAGGKFEADTLAFRNDDDVTLTVTGEGSSFKLYSASGRTVTGTYNYAVNEGAIIVAEKASFDVSGLANAEFVNSGSITLSSASAKFATLTNNGTVTVSGASTLNIGTLTGNMLQVVADTTLADSVIGGNVSVGFNAENAADTTLTLAGDTSIGTLYVGKENRTNDYKLVIAGEETTVKLGSLYSRTGSTTTISNGATLDISNYWQSKGTVTVDASTINHSGVNFYVYNNDSTDTAAIALMNGAVLNHISGHSLTLGSTTETVSGVAKGNASVTLEGGSTLNVNRLYLNATGTVEEVAGAEAKTSLTAVDSTVTARGEVGIGAGATVSLDNSAFTANTLISSGAIVMDSLSTITCAGAFTSTGTITARVDAAQSGVSFVQKLINASTLTVNDSLTVEGGRDGAQLVATGNALWLDNSDKSTILINSGYAGEVGSAIVDRDGYFFGFNALMEYSTSIGADSAVEFTGGSYRFEDGFSFTGREFTVSGDTSFNKVTGGSVAVTGGTLSIDTVVLTADVATLSGALLAFSGSGMADLENLVLTGLDTNRMANRTKYVLATGVKDDSFAVTRNGETYELNVRKDGLLVGVENGELYVQKTDDWFNKAGDSPLTVLPADGYVFGGSDMYEDTSRNERLKLEVVTTDSENAGARVYGGGLFRNDALFSGTQKCEVTVTSGGVGKGVFGGNQIESGSIGGMLISSVTINSADGSFGLIAGGHHVGGSGDLNSTGETSVTINNGSFKGVIVGGSVIANDASAKVMGDTTVTIAGGTFDKQIFGGGFVQNNGSLNQYGNTTVTISGGTFSSNIYGGHGASNQNTSSNAMLFGNTNITISGGIFNGNIYGGGFDRSKVLGDTHITFTGATGADFSVNGIIDGDASNARYWGNNSFVGGDRYLTFDAFSGEFGATLITNIDQMKVTGGSDVNLKNQLDLSEVSQWEFDFGSSLEGFAQNDLAGDSLVLSGWEDQLGDKGWTVMSGSSITGFGEMEVTNGSNLIFAWNADEQYYLGSIGDEQFKLSMEDGVMKLAKLA